jgi:hypothetical protein
MGRLKRLVERGFWVAVLFCASARGVAQGTMQVASTSDGSGQFSWTFSAAGGVFPEVWQFKMKLYGVQDTSSPPGWAASLDPDEFVTWNYIGGGGAPFTGAPMTISIRSSSTQSIGYGGAGNLIYPDGLYSGPVVFGRFVYEGPMQIPEPSMGLYWLLGACALLRSPTRTGQKQSPTRTVT